MTIKKLITIICVLFYFYGFSQKIIEKNIQSKILKTTRNLKIYIPEGYEKDSIINYPLAVVFDAEYLFDAYVGNAVLFAAKDKAPKQIIVGISMEKTKKEDTYFDINTGNLTVRNNAFYQFIRDEVIFYIKSNFRSSSFISLIGEGTSANLITHFLREKKPFINSYICINPIFSNFVEQQFQSYNFQKFLKQDSLFYLYINNSTSFSSKKQAKIGKLQNGLTGLKLDNFNFINDTIFTSNNVSAISEAIPRALTKTFQTYCAISKDEFDKNIKSLSPKEAISYLKNKYLKIEYLFGGNLSIREKDIYTIEKIIIEKENGDYLLNFGKMVLKLFPNSPLGDYYIGKYYESGKMYEEALRYYRIGYGKIKPSDRNSDAFYENISRLLGGK